MKIEIRFDQIHIDETNGMGFSAVTSEQGEDPRVGTYYIAEGSTNRVVETKVDIWCVNLEDLGVYAVLR